jgi:tetratricopeptide (TPR) repeat protein
MWMVGCSPSNEAPKEPVTTSLDSLNKVAKRYLKVDLDTAEMLTRSILTQAKGANDLSNVADASLTLGTVFKQRGICDSSILLFREALQIGQESNNEFIVGRALTNIGTAYMCVSDYKNALLYSDSAYEILSPQFEFDYMAKAASNAAVAEIQLEQNDEAKTGLEEPFCMPNEQTMSDSW